MPRKRRTTVQRAVDVMLDLGRSGRPQGTTELADSLGLPKASVFRLLKDLVEVRCVSYDEDTQAYKLGPVLIELGDLARKQLELTDLARPVLEEVARGVQETVNLGVLNQSRVLILDSVTDRKGPKLTVQLGPVSDLHCSALGKALLSCLSDSEMQRVLEGASLESRTPNTVTCIDHLCSEVDEVRDSGVAYDREEYEEGLFCTAVPVCTGPDGDPVAISVSGPVSRLKGRRRCAIEQHLADAARKLGGLLCRSSGIQATRQE